MLEVLIKLASAIVVLGLATVIGLGLWRVVEIPLRKWRASTFDYIYIDDDGNARELNAAEDEYIGTALFANGDADQFMKPSYESLTPDGRLHGYLKRRQLPSRVPVGPAPQ